MTSHTVSEGGEGASPPSADLSISNGNGEAPGATPNSEDDAASDPAPATPDSTRAVGNDNLVDVALLVDSPAKLHEVLDIFLNKLSLTREVVASKHPGVNLRVAFISYRDFEPVVADLEPWDNDAFKALVNVVQKQGSAGQHGQDVLRGLAAVPSVGWSAKHRLLVQIADGAPAPTPKDGAGGEANDRTSSSAALHRLRDECGLQTVYFAYFNEATRALASELKAAGGGQPGWLVTERLSDPDVLPLKIADLAIELLDKAAGAPGVAAGAAGAAGRARRPERAASSEGPVPEDIGDVAEEADEPPTQGSRPPSQASQAAANLKVTTLRSTELEAAQTPHRYRGSSDGDGSPGLKEEHSNISSSRKSSDNRSHKSSGTAAGSGSGSHGGKGGIGSVRPSGAGGGDDGAASPKGGGGTARPSEAGSARSRHRSAAPSEAATGAGAGAGAGTGASVKSSPWSERGAGDEGLIKTSRLSNAGTGPVIVGGGAHRGSVPPSEAGAAPRRVSGTNAAVKGTPRASELGAGAGSVKGPSARGTTPRPSEADAAGAAPTAPGTPKACSPVPEAEEGRAKSPEAASGKGSASKSAAPPGGDIHIRGPLSEHKEGAASAPAQPLKNPSSAPPSESGGGKAALVAPGSARGSLGASSPRSVDTPTPEPPPPAEISSSVAPQHPLLPGIESLGTDFSGVPISQQQSTTAAGAAAPSLAGGLQPLPWSKRALEDFKAEMKRTAFELPNPRDDPRTARLDTVFSNPHDLWPVLPPGGMYCLEACDPRSTFAYLQHRDFPSTKVRVNTYFGKWGRHLVDYVVAWQPIPRAEAAWQLGDAKQPPQPWEPRQVVAHTTNGEYQYANTRMKFRGPRSTKPDAEVVDYSDAHGVDLPDTKAAHESAPRNSDKDRDAHLLDPPRPNTWGELARRPLISNLRAHGGGTYIHHVNYDNSGLRTTCGRRVPAGYYFTLIPNVPAKVPAVPGGSNAHVRPSSAGRAIAAARQTRSISLSPAAATSASLLRRARPVSKSTTGPPANGRLTESNSASAADGRRGPPDALRMSVVPPGHDQYGIAEEESRPESSLKAGMPPGLLSSPPLAASQSFLVLDKLGALTPNKDRWRTYDVPFNHPLNAARAAELGAEEARASGRNVRTFSDAAAVMKVAEQELRMSRAFVPGPLVVPTWEDIPRLYVEHMEAARALMPVTELDTYGTSRLHQLIYHLQCAATLEYDRLDAKLLLLPQMARLGKKSAEIDAWLQGIVEHASFLYDKLEIYDTNLWGVPAAAAKPEPSLPALQSTTTITATTATTTTTTAGGLPLRASLAVLPPPPPSTMAPGQEQGWVFPDPLKGTAHASRSAVNASAQVKPAIREQPVAPHVVTPVEWSAITNIMDPSRHKTLIAAWIRLRPLMTGAVLKSSGDASSSCAPGSSLADYGSSDAGATASGFGDAKQASGAITTAAAAANEPYFHGVVNREVLDYLHQDLSVMSAPEFVPPPPPPASLPKHRGYRGEGPLPPEHTAEMPTVHRPVRCRGVEETPLPSAYSSMDIWNLMSKSENAPPWSGRGPHRDPDPRDAGAVRTSQVAVQRLQAARQFAASQQAAIRKSMLLAKGLAPPDESDTPYYGSDVAEDDFATDITNEGAHGGTPRRRVRGSIRASSGADPQGAPRYRPGTACQTGADLGMPTPEEEVEEQDRISKEESAMEARRRLLRGKDGKTRQEILDEALQAAEDAIRSLQPRPIGSGVMTPPPYEPDSPRLLLVREEPRDAELALAMRPPKLKHCHSEVLQDDWYKHTGPSSKRLTNTAQQQQQQHTAKPQLQRNMSIASVYNPGGQGPEPFSLEKIWRNGNVGSDVESGMDAIALDDLPAATSGFFYAEPTGFGGLVDYDTAMARRRAIAGAEVAHLQGDFIPKSDVFDLLVVYCNLGRQPDQVALLQQAIEAPVSMRAVSATQRAAAAVATAAGPTSALAASAEARRGGGTAGTRGAAALDAEATRQRIHATAWLLGVTWRRISNETYISFLSRVLGWPPEIAASMHRTRATHLIARALVRGHDLRSVPSAPPRQ